MVQPDPGRTVTDRRHPLFARYYARLSPGMDDEGLGALRSELLAPLSGSVVEIGAGNGRNFTRYRSPVTSVTAVEPEPYLRALAERAAPEAAVPVTVVAGVAEDLPLPDAGYDAAVLCLVMCSLRDRPGALAQVRRVLRPGGVLAFLEHTGAETPVLRTVQRVVDATVWPLLAGGCHTATDPVGDIRAARFEVTALRRLRFPDSRISLPPTPHVLGIARHTG
jgi:ubiquinone/menaquinone biosynthesis C-methylase UbiE